MFDVSTIQEIEGEPRMRDLDIAEALGFEFPIDIRKLIYRNLEELAQFGIIATVAIIHKGAGRPVEECWLNEQQAYYICTQSKAKTAFEVTKLMIEVFTAYHHGKGPRGSIRLSCTGWGVLGRDTQKTAACTFVSDCDGGVTIRLPVWANGKEKLAAEFGLKG